MYLSASKKKGKEKNAASFSEIFLLDFNALGDNEIYETVDS